MASPLNILRLNDKLDVPALRAQFAEDRRLQIRNVLESEAAERLSRLLAERTPWGLTWRAGEDGPHRVRREQLGGLGSTEMKGISDKLNAVMRGSDFAFIYSQYPASDAASRGWSTSSEHDGLVADLNHPELLDFIREVTGVAEISWCDAQVTHFGPGQFLSLHEDIDAFEGDNRLVAYVLNLTLNAWRPDWGGYLNFFDADGDIVHGYGPRFNSLNIFRVPQWHNVSLVAPYSTGDRLAVTGWFRKGTRDR